MATCLNVDAAHAQLIFYSARTIVVAAINEEELNARCDQAESCTR